MFGDSIGRIGIFVFVLFNAFTFSVSAQGSGSLNGRVLDSLTGDPLPGASIRIDGLAITAETDRTGAFAFLRIPTGPHTVTVSYLGFEPATRTVEVGASRNNDVTFELTAAIQASVTVSAPMLEGQAKALNQQKESINIQSIVSADQIGRFPDPNAAEATQRIPGITIERDQGEGRYVQVRGTEARLNAMQINGERVPSPEGDVRAVALDVVPADLLEAIEVSKALTADQDADSIGGAVNLVTKGAPERQRVSLTLGWGYNALVKNDIQMMNGTFGRRLFGGRTGLLLSGSYFNTDRGSESVEPSYDEGFLDELEVRDYAVNRTRWGINPYLDHRFSENSEIYFRGIFNRFRDQEYRRRVTYAVSDGEIARELKDRLETQTIAQAAFGGRHLLPGFFQIDYRVSYGYADEDEPNAVYSTFFQEDVLFNPNVDPNSIDPNNIQANPLNEDFSLYEFDGLENETNFTSERNFNAHFNGSLPLPTRDGFAGLLKFGVKNRFSKKQRNNEVFANELPDEAIPVFTQVLDPDYTKTSYRGGLYNIGTAFPAPGVMRGLFNTPDIETEKDFEEDSADYRARENIFAVYAMGQLSIGDKFQLIPGIRYEQTDVRYTGYEVQFDEEGDLASIVPMDGRNSFKNYFPSIHANYRLTDRTAIRAAYTRSLARPNFVDLVPYRLILDEDRELVRGNPFLEPTTSDNFDLMAEHYFDDVGIVSGGIFYKKLNNYIFPFRSLEERPVGGPNGPLDIYEVTEPRNGEKADLFGIELSFSKRLTFLPKPLDGFGIYSNFTHVTSDAILPNSDPELPGRKSILPGQAKNTANFAVSYERFGFSGRGSLHYRDRYLSEVAGSPSEDLFIENHLQFDLSLSQRITKNIRVFAEFLNLNNRPFKSYEGVSNRIRQDERYLWWSTFGVKLDW